MTEEIRKVRRACFDLKACSCTGCVVVQRAKAGKGSRAQPYGYLAECWLPINLAETDTGYARRSRGTWRRPCRPPSSRLPEHQNRWDGSERHRPMGERSLEKKWTRLILMAEERCSPSGEARSHRRPQHCDVGIHVGLHDRPCAPRCGLHRFCGDSEGSTRRRRGLALGR